MEYKFKCILEKFQKSKVWSYHFKIPNSIAVELLKDGKRIVCTVNNILTYQCGILSAGSLGFFINVNQIIREKANISLNDEVSLLLKKDTSNYGLPVPKVFQELVKQDSNFNKIFHSLTKGKQRSLIHIVGSFKSEHKQLEKLMIIRDYLIQVNGNLDFKDLLVAFRNNRFK